MIVLRNKEFSDSNKEAKTDKKALVAGLASMGIGGYNSGKVHGIYGGVRDASKDIIKESSEYKILKAKDEKSARKFKETAARAKKIRERVSKSPLKLSDKIKSSLSLRKIERSANKMAKSTSRATDKLVNDIAKKEGLEYVAKHNKKNIAGALAGTIAGTALISKSIKNKKKEDDSIKK